MINGRRKGHSYERNMAKEWRDIGWPQAERQLEYQISEALGVDLKNTGPFLVQTKCKRQYVPMNTIEEVQQKKGMYPLLISKADHQKPIACMYWEDLKELLQTLKKEEIL
jgi:hypothetical protein